MTWRDVALPAHCIPATQIIYTAMSTFLWSNTARQTRTLMTSSTGLLMMLFYIITATSAEFFQPRNPVFHEKNNTQHSSRRNKRDDEVSARGCIGQQQDSTMYKAPWVNSTVLSFHIPKIWASESREAFDTRTRSARNKTSFHRVDVEGENAFLGNSHAGADHIHVPESNIGTRFMPSDAAETMTKEGPGDNMMSQVVSIRAGNIGQPEPSIRDEDENKHDREKGGEGGGDGDEILEYSTRRDATATRGLVSTFFEWSMPHNMTDTNEHTNKTIDNDMMAGLTSSGVLLAAKRERMLATTNQNMPGKLSSTLSARRGPISLASIGRPTMDAIFLQDARPTTFFDFSSSDLQFRDCNQVYDVLLAINVLPTMMSFMTASRDRLYDSVSYLTGMLRTMRDQLYPVPPRLSGEENMSGEVIRYDEPSVNMTIDPTPMALSRPCEPSRDDVYAVYEPRDNGTCSNGHVYATHFQQHFPQRPHFLRHALTRRATSSRHRIFPDGTTHVESPSHFLRVSVRFPRITTGISFPECLFSSPHITRGDQFQGKGALDARKDAHFLRIASLLLSLRERFPHVVTGVSFPERPSLSMNITRRGCRTGEGALNDWNCAHIRCTAPHFFSGRARFPRVSRQASPFLSALR